MAIGRADPGTRLGDDGGAGERHGQSMQTRAVIAGLARHRIADDEIVARDVREAAEVDAVGEAVAAGGEALVAAGGHREGVASRDRLGHLLPQLDQHAVERRRDGSSPRRRSPSLAPLVNVSLPAVNQPSAKSSRPGGVKADGAVERRDGAAAVESRIGEIDGAARIAEIGRAGRGVEPPALLVEPVR